MFLLFLFIGILILVQVNKSQAKHFKQCPKPHKWVVRFENDDKRGYLVCRECGKIPGED